MRDLVLVIFILGFVVASFRRPYFMALGYIWVDFLQPQTLTYHFLAGAPVAMFMAVGALLMYVFLDAKDRARIGVIQVLMLLLAVYATANSFGWAMLPQYATEKWDWVWKSLLFATFLPWVLTTRRRIEAAAFVMVLSLAAITISGGAKTLLGGGGYGTVAFLVQNNTGLFEGSTLATVAFSLVPLTLWLYRRNGIVKRNWLSFLATAGIIFSMMLVTVGSEARTGLVAGAALAVLLWLVSNKKLLLGGGFVVASLIAIPFLPASFTERMQTIQAYDEDESAMTRLAVWGWTIDFVQDNPLGGGFGIFRINQLDVEIKSRQGEDGNVDTATVDVSDKARAYHNSYFEVLAELGYPGLLIYLSILFLALKSAWTLRKIRTGVDADDIWYRDLGTMMVVSILVYMSGSMFVSIAFQPPFYDLMAITIGAGQIARRQRAANLGEIRFGPKRAPHVAVR